MEPRPTTSPRSPAPTLGTIDTRDNGFDTIRLLAAAAVLVSHSFALTAFAEPLEDLGRGVTLGTMAVGGFFVISGLLITMSAERRGTGPFLRQRARRLMPALLVCVFACTVVGALLTGLPVGRYWTSLQTVQFLGNAVFLPVSQALPGVFTDQPNGAANGSLWTLKFEVACYAVSFAFARLRFARRTILLAGWIASLILSRHFTGDEGGVWFFVERTAWLFRFYGAGMLLYAFRDRIALRAHWALAALALVALSPLVGLFAEAAATLGAYALIVAAYRAPRWFRAVTARGDISYGVYLYAFPIQQLLVPLSLKSPVPWLTNLALALPLTILAGVTSWLLVERRFLTRPGDRTAAAHAF